MPAWDSYKAEATERGSLAFEVYMAQSTPAKAPEDVKAVLPDHLAYIAQLEAEGKVRFAGPLSDETGTQMQGMGMLILRAATFDEAKALADGDPMHSSGARTYVMRKWMINEGQVTMTIGLGSQRAKFE
jgi:uncharacterized protein YciI